MILNMIVHFSTTIYSLFDFAILKRIANLNEGLEF